MADETQNNGGEAGAASEATKKMSQNSIDFLLDVPLTLSVELGRSRMIVNDLLQLGQGSVIELTKIVGEPLEVLVNEKLIARGEVVTLNDKFAVRLTDIISPTDRLDQLT
jgi:flagellar motor switch protein FliN/FliY